MNLTGKVYRTGVIYSEDYNDLKNKPAVDGIELTSETTLDELGAVHYEEGKTLSENDFTDELKRKVEASIDGVTVNGVKVTTFAVPVKTSELKNDSGFITSADLPDVSKYLTQEDAKTLYENVEDFTAYKNETAETIKALEDKIAGLIDGEEVSY